MSIKNKRINAFLLSVLLVTAQLNSSLSAFADTGSSGTTTSDNLTQGNWVYTVTESQSGGMPGAPPGGEMPDSNGQSSNGDGNGSTDSSGKTATLLWGTGDEKNGNVVMIPGKLGGYTVTVLGNGAQNISSNNKISNNYVLIPEGVTTFSNRMIYDYNSTSGWSIPSSVSTIDSGAFLSSPGTFYGESGSAAETYAESDSTRDFVTYSSDNSQDFTAESADNGYILPNGTYHLPTGMIDGKHTITFSVVADYQYKIKELTVDGNAIDEAAGLNSYDLDYTFTKNSSNISVTYEEDANDTRDPDEIAGFYNYDAPEINSAAVTNDIDLSDESLYEYHGVNTGSTEKYLNSMGISTGDYYGANGKTYKMIYSSQTSDTPEYYSKAEVINGIYDKKGYKYGQDYDLIRLYNYYENVSSGPSQGEVALYCTYLYKEINPSEIVNNVIDKSNTNTASFFAQLGSNLTINNFTTYCYTGSKGPSEAGNFYGLGSSVQIDGGDITTPASTVINKDTTTLTLNQPNILGTVNSIYAAANGVGYIEGGNIFSCTSGGHGPYVSTGGQLLLNTKDTNLVDKEGNVNRDTSSLTATTRPSSDLGTMTRKDGEMTGVFAEHDLDQTAIVTGDESGTALATDTGGGVILANQVTTKTFGLRCAGVYSIGSNESWVYCYNSNLTSFLDAALTSATGGYIMAYNCDLTGVMGIKTRAGGDSASDETGVHVYNSRVSAYYDAEEMKAAYDVADPADWDDSILDSIKDKGATSISQLNMFLDKANSPSFIEDSLNWWFTDKSKTPGYSGGNKFAVIYVENSSTPIYVESTKLVNKNYEEYGNPETLEEGQTPADNLLLSVEGAGNANVYFTNENSSTSWDLTGEEEGSCELNGDFYVGAYSQGGDGPDVASGANTLNAHFSNSEWTGTILYGDDEKTGTANLNIDADSSWNVTADTVVSGLEIDDMSKVTSDKAVTVSYTSSQTVTPGTYGNVTFVKTGNDSDSTNETAEENNTSDTANHLNVIYFIAGAVILAAAGFGYKIKKSKK